MEDRYNRSIFLWWLRIFSCLGKWTLRSGISSTSLTHYLTRLESPCINNSPTTEPICRLDLRTSRVQSPLRDNFVGPQRQDRRSRTLQQRRPTSNVFLTANESNRPSMAHVQRRLRTGPFIRCIPQRNDYWNFNLELQAATNGAKLAKFGKKHHTGSTHPSAPPGFLCQPP